MSGSSRSSRRRTATNSYSKTAEENEKDTDVRVEMSAVNVESDEEEKISKRRAGPVSPSKSFAISQGMRSSSYRSRGKLAKKASSEIYVSSSIDGIVRTSSFSSFLKAENTDTTEGDASPNSLLSMRIRERADHKVVRVISSQTLLVLEPNELLCSCISKMVSNHVEVALVLPGSHSETPQMVTRTNIVRKIVSSSVPPHKVQVWCVASSHAPVVRSKTKLSECASIMNDRKRGALFVLEDDGKEVAGIVTAYDIYHYVFDDTMGVVPFQRTLSLNRMQHDRLATSTVGLRHWALAVVDHVAVSMVVLLLMIADLSLSTYSLVRDEEDDDDDDDSNRGVLWWSTMTILLLFLLEIGMRMFAYRIQFLTFIDILDTAIVVLAFASMFFEHRDWAGLVVFLRIVRFMRAIRVIALFNRRCDRWTLSARRLVSQNKRRIRIGKFNLDLTYIEPSIVAMSFPSSGAQQVYRNPIDEVACFLDTKHEDAYRVYNLCSERDYPAHFFHGRVERVPFDDHNPPTLKQMLVFTESAVTWMTKGDDNVAVVHCKGGKGRTGTMIAAVLLRAGLCRTAEEALRRFAQKRTSESGIIKARARSHSNAANDKDDAVDDDAKTNDAADLVGVSGPSQIRYVRYFAEMVSKARRRRSCNFRGNAGESPHRRSLDGVSSTSIRSPSLAMHVSVSRSVMTLLPMSKPPRRSRVLKAVRLCPAPKIDSGYLSLIVQTFDNNCETDDDDDDEKREAEEGDDASLLRKRIVLEKKVWFNGDDDGNDNDDRRPAESVIEFDCEDVVVSGDVKFVVKCGTRFGDFDVGGFAKPKEICFWYIHTSLEEIDERVILGKSDIDVAAKDTRCDVFEKTFRVVVEFDECPAGRRADESAATKARE